MAASRGEGESPGHLGRFERCRLEPVAVIEGPVAETADAADGE
jgi:hypothetical protein